MNIIDTRKRPKGWRRRPAEWGARWANRWAGGGDTAVSIQIPLQPFNCVPTSQLLCFVLKMATDFQGCFACRYRVECSPVCSPSPTSHSRCLRQRWEGQLPRLKQKEQIPGAVVPQSSAGYQAEAETLPTPSPVWLPSPLPHPPGNAALIKHLCRNPISGLLRGTQAKTFMMCK